MTAIEVPCDTCPAPVRLLHESGTRPTSARHHWHKPPHEHQWQPAGVLDSRDRFALVFGMCTCGEITAKKWDF